MNRVELVRAMYVPEVWRTIPKAQEGTSWTPADLTFEQLTQGTRLLEASRAGGVMLWFWIKGISDDATADIQIAGWPLFGDVNIPNVPGNGGSTTQPHGWLVADGQIAFDYDSPVAANPMTGAEETWYPGHMWTPDANVVGPLTVRDVGSTLSPAAGAAQPMILEIPDLKAVSILAVQADALPVDATLMAVAALVD